MANEEKNSTLKLSLGVLFCIALAFGVFFCINHVGSLNRQAAVLESCQQAQTSNPPTVAQYPDCPKRPVSKAEIANLRDQADTYGNVGWVCFFILIFGVGSEVWDRIRN